MGTASQKEFALDVHINGNYWWTINSLLDGNFYTTLFKQLCFCSRTHPISNILTK